jgi:hypothetical protein
MKKPISIVLVLLVAGVVGYLVYRFIHKTDGNPETGAPDARSAWINVLSKCASTQFLGTNVFFFGVSNSVGPGSVWRKESDGSLRLRFDLNELEPDAAKRAALVEVGNTADCSGQTGTKWRVALGLPFESQISGLNATLGGELRKARSVTVGVSGWNADVLRERAYEQLLKIKPEYGDEFIGDDRFVAENAIRVVGFNSSFEFDKSAAGNVKGNLAVGPITLSNGTKLQADWESDTKLKLTSSEPFYILAAIGQVSSRDGTFVFGKAAPAPVAVQDERAAAHNDLQIRQAVLAKIPPDVKGAVSTVNVTNGKVLVAGDVNPSQQRRVKVAAQAAIAERHLPPGEHPIEVVNKFAR